METAAVTMLSILHVATLKSLFNSAETYAEAAPFYELEWGSLAEGVYYLRHVLSEKGRKELLSQLKTWMHEVGNFSLELKEQVMQMQTTEDRRRRQKWHEMCSLNKIMKVGSDRRAQLRNDIHSQIKMIKEVEQENERLRDLTSSLQMKMKAASENREELRNTFEMIMKNEANRKWYEVISERFPNLNVDERQLWYRSMDENFPLIKEVDERRGESRNTFLEEMRKAEGEDWYQLAEERFPLRKVGLPTRRVGKTSGKKATVNKTSEESSTVTAEEKTKAPTGRIELGLVPALNLKAAWYKTGTWSNRNYQPGRGYVRMANRRFNYSGITAKVNVKGQTATKRTTANTTTTNNLES